MFTRGGQPGSTVVVVAILAVFIVAPLIVGLMLRAWDRRRPDSAGRRRSGRPTRATGLVGAGSCVVLAVFLAAAGASFWAGVALVIAIAVVAWTTDPSALWR